MLSCAKNVLFKSITSLSIIRLWVRIQHTAGALDSNLIWLWLLVFTKVGCSRATPAFPTKCNKNKVQRNRSTVLKVAFNTNKLICQSIIKSLCVSSFIHIKTYWMLKQISQDQLYRPFWVLFFGTNRCFNVFP